MVRRRKRLARKLPLGAKVAELEAKLSQNSGNSSAPPSRDPAAERARQAEVGGAPAQEGRGQT
ncbi:MAG: DUF6444 domain-containing protein [Acidimicrobiales bacterium]